MPFSFWLSAVAMFDRPLSQKDTHLRTHAITKHTNTHKTHACSNVWPITFLRLHLSVIFSHRDRKCTRRITQLNIWINVLLITLEYFTSIRLKDVTLDATTFKILYIYIPSIRIKSVLHIQHVLVRNIVLSYFLCRVFSEKALYFEALPQML